ncbi:integrating conjugative element protein [Pseudomonadota bacterium]
MRNHFRWGRCIGFVTVLVPLVAQAELTVIYDSGNTQPLAPFLEVIEDIETPQQQPAPSNNQLGAADINTLLPIKSPSLSPGQVQPQAVNRPFTRPFFLIGSDALSRQWLSQYRDRLLEIGAVGMLVQAETASDLEAIAKIGKGLQIMPASGADIAQALGIKHYPVLVSKEGIEQ